MTARQADNASSDFIPADVRQTVVAQALPKGQVSIVRLKSLRRNSATAPYQLENSDLIVLQLRPFGEQDLWLDGRRAPFVPYGAGTVTVYDLDREWVADLKGAFDCLHFHMPRPLLEETVDDLGGRQRPRLYLPPHLSAHDPIIHSLGQSLLPALARPGEASQIFIDHVEPRSRRTSPTVMAASASDGKDVRETHAVAGAPCEGIAARASRRQPRAGRRGERMRAVSQLFREGVSSDDRAAAASLAHRAARRTGEGVDAQSEPAVEHDRRRVRFCRSEPLLADLHAPDRRQPSPLARGPYLSVVMRGRTGEVRLVIRYRNVCILRGSIRPGAGRARWRRSHVRRAACATPAGLARACSGVRRVLMRRSRSACRDCVARAARAARIPPIETTGLRAQMFERLPAAGAEGCRRCIGILRPLTRDRAVVLAQPVGCGREDREIGVEKICAARCNSGSTANPSGSRCDFVASTRSRATDTCDACACNQAASQRACVTCTSHCALSASLSAYAGSVVA